MVCFKYRCFQEYFYAQLLRHNPELLQKAMDGEAVVENARELDLLSGLSRQNSGLLNAVCNFVLVREPHEVSKRQLLEFDKIVENESNIGISRVRLQQIRQKRLSADQVDDLMDAAERNISQRPEGEKLEHRSKSENDVGKNLQQEPTPDEKHWQKAMKFKNYVIAIELLGRIIRNSEFTDANEKANAAKIFFKSWVKSYLSLTQELIQVVESTKCSMENSTQPMTEEEARATNYILQTIFLTLVSEIIRDQIGTVKLESIYSDLMVDKELTSGERFLVSMLTFDLGHKNWHVYWGELIKRHINHRFVLETLVQKAWTAVHTRVINDQERRRIEDILEQIESALGTQKRDKSRWLGELRRAAKKNQNEGE